MTKNILKEIIITLISTITIGEIICRVLPITPDIPIRENRDGFYMLKKNQEGYYIRGKFPYWLKSHYFINNEGFVSVKDYKFDDCNKLKIALVGDSFVEGFQSDSNKSIGRLMEEINPYYEVYEFGLSGYNFQNYIEIYNKYKLNKFRHVFLITDSEDLLSKTAAKTIYSNTIEIKEKIFRSLYNNFYLFKYLNWNHALVSKVLDFKNIFRLSKKIDKEKEFFKPNIFLDTSTNVEIVLKSNDDFFLRQIYPDINFIEIYHSRKPFNFGFDKHWNLNGKKNVAETLSKWITQQEK